MKLPYPITVLSRRLLFPGLVVAAAAIMIGLARTAAETREVPAVGHTVILVGGTARAGNQFTVAVELDAVGDETTGAFTINFDPTKLTISNISSNQGSNPDVTVGSGVPSTGASVWINANQVPIGRLGLLISTSSYYTPSPPNRQLLRVRFTVLPNAPTGPTAITFGSVPTPQSWSTFFGDPIQMTWVGGTINIDPPTTVRLEGDVSPRTNGDETVLSVDVIQMRRFATGLDTIDPTNTEFQRADSAPRATLGDGMINASDVIQARRYATGLDPVTTAGGPTASSGRPPRSSPK